MLELCFRQNLIKERRSEGIMTGLTQQDQKTSDPFTLEAVSEEEQEPNIRLNKVNDAIPFDKCIEADKQADEEEKKRKWCNQLGTAKTTKTQSKKEVRKWLGTGIFIKTILKTTRLEITVFPISVGGVIVLWKLLSFFLDNSEQIPTSVDANLKTTFLAFSFCILVITAFSFLFDIFTASHNFIATKMSEKDYMIKENIVDCPIAVKNKFLSYIKADELYGRVNTKKNCFEWLKDNGECYHYWNFDKPKDKNDMEYQMKYLADQLEAGKVYKLSDIITDKVKKKAGK